MVDVGLIAEKIAADGEGVVALSYYKGVWMVAIEWGREAPDSPMRSAAAYGQAPTVEAALADAMAEAGWTEPAPS